jgi:hypothetical protein
MVSTNQQHGDNNLCFYARCGPMCNDCNIYPNRKSASDATLSCNHTNLFGINIIAIAINFHERNFGNMVASIEQFRNDNLHLYAKRRSVRHNCNAYHYSKSGKYVAGIYSCISHLRRQYSIAIAHYFHQRHYRNLVARLE